MDAKEAERIVIAKPVPSRPTTYSNFRSFSELLAGAINASPSCPCSDETTVTAIRPKTVRFKPTEIKTPADRVISQAELSGAAVCSRSDTVDEVLKPESKSTVIYKPLAKVVSRTTFSLLANLGNSNVSHQQTLSQVEAHVQPPNQYKYHFRSGLHQNISSSQKGSQKATEPPKMALENTEDDQKYLPPAGNSDRTSYDGYNWRKYGQKQVKGSEYPRSYYKCTHPNCPVKKKVERSLDGQIAEVVYKGEHTHSKPQPPKRNASTSQGQRYVSDETGQGTNIPSWSSQISVRNNENLGGRLEYQKNYSGKASLSCDPAATGEINTALGTPENSCGLQGDCEGGSKGLEAEDDEPKSKRRKLENEGSIPRGAEEPRITGQNGPTDSEIIGDGFRWRKYGQKVVKGNPYPRSYYRCTSLKCNVRKHVERAIDDPTAFIMTYEGKHNHEMPTKHTNPASESDSQAAISKDKA